MPQVIEWVNAGPDDIIYKYPNEDITWGAQLVVHEYEMAVFFRDGKAYDVFGAGRHTLTTLNLPLLTSLLTRIAGFGSNKPFKAMVIYIATKVFNGKWGTSAQTTELAPLKVFGQFLFKIEDASLFVNEVVGGQNAYTTEDVNNFLRGFLNEKIIAELSHYDLVTVFTRLQETSIIVKNSVLDYFKRLGIELTDLRFEGIDTTPEYRERLFWLKTGSTPADTVLRMETVKSAAASLGSIRRRRRSRLRHRHGAYTSNHEFSRSSSGASAHSSPCDLPQMRRACSSHIKVLSRMRNQSYTSISKQQLTAPNAATQFLQAQSSAPNAEQQ